MRRLSSRRRIIYSLGVRIVLPVSGERIDTVMGSLLPGVARKTEAAARLVRPARLSLLAEGIEQLADPKIGLGGVPHLHVTIQAIVIASADPLAIDVPGG